MNPEVAKNRKALRDYEIVERFEAGIELKGTEVKSVRAGKINIGDAFARVEGRQVFLYGCDIQPYAQASHTQHEAKRTRRLLLHRREIDKLAGLTAERGLALVALRVYWKNNRLKLELGAGKGKGHIDKREDLKKKTMDREMAREMARFNKGKR
jgi:SsrA-binding protein